ncbi:MAG: DUF2310 family Zn-ribbon-containing protein [Bacillota bacterium]|nr:DUF2310 family Zn-ribbon-containing protein [Bacillota bacterium]
MFLFTITTFPDERQSEENYKKFEEEQDLYFGTLIKNGQILPNDCNTIFEGDKYITYALAPEENSFSMNYANKYVKENYEKLLRISRTKPKIKLLGKSKDYMEACTCQSPSWYMLYSDYTINESPVVCGDCGRTVPLYKLPKILEEDEYWSVLSWQRAYNACDELFMAGIGERFAYQRISKPTNDLYKLGKELCEAFEKALGKPFYYYLFKYYSPHKSTCPKCGGPCKLDSENKSFIDYRCDNCRLVGDL